MVVWRQAQAEAAKRADGLGPFWDASLRVKGRVNLRRVQASIFFASASDGHAPCAAQLLISSLKLKPRTLQMNIQVSRAQSKVDT